jgi:hypothetical protein
LIEIANSSKEDVVMVEAKGLCKNAFEDFEFLISLCIWYKILDKVNWVSKELQKEKMNLEKAIKNIKELILFLEKMVFETCWRKAKRLQKKLVLIWYLHQKE